MDESHLRVWQREALDVWRGCGHRGIVQAVTGTGKTKVGYEAISEGFRVVVTVPTLELADQWAEQLQQLPLIRVGRWSGASRASLTKSSSRRSNRPSTRKKKISQPSSLCPLSLPQASVATMHGNRSSSAVVKEPARDSPHQLAESIRLRSPLTKPRAAPRTNQATLTSEVGPRSPSAKGKRKVEPDVHLRAGCEDASDQRRRRHRRAS